MPPTLLMLLSLLCIGMGIHGLYTGKVRAGSKGFKSHFYVKESQPMQFYFFVLFYISTGLFILWSAVAK